MHPQVEAERTEVLRLTTELSNLRSAARQDMKAAQDRETALKALLASETEVCMAIVHVYVTWPPETQQQYRRKVLNYLSESITTAKKAMCANNCPGPSFLACKCLQNDAMSVSGQPENSPVHRLPVVFCTLLRGNSCVAMHAVGVPL